MMCYRDMTFCSFWKDCKLGSECSRAYTSEVDKAAKKWWGSDDAPVCFYCNKPDCFEGEDEP